MDANDAGTQIDALIDGNPDWRGAVLAQARRAIIAVDPAITETWKWMGAPVWELDEPGLQDLVRAAIERNKAKPAKVTK